MTQTIGLLLPTPHLRGRCPAMAKSNEIPKARLKNLDDLFNLNDGVNPLEKTIPIMETQPHHKRAVVSIVIETLTPFSGHPFRLYEGERLDDMVASIKANGVLIPIIVRRIEAKLEILAGHNRVNAAKLAGLDEIPTIIFENVSDEDAMVYVVETNLLQRSFSDMTHSEKAAVIALHHSKMFSQGKRNDILEQIKMLENPHEYRNNNTSLQVGAVDKGLIFRD
jgi:ParB family chromosome partitioning protein